MVREKDVDQDGARDTNSKREDGIAEGVPMDEALGVIQDFPVDMEDTAAGKDFTDLATVHDG